MDELSETLRNVYREDYAYEYLYPYPLADLYRRYRVSRSEVDRLGYLLAAGEASLKFMSALALALGSQRSAVKESLPEIQSMLVRPSFGTWRQSLEAFATPNGETLVSPLETAVIKCVRDKSGREAEYLSAVRILVEERNKYVHGGTMTTEVASSVLNSVVKSFREAFRALFFLARCPFVVCEEIRRVRRPPCFEAVMRICQGSNPIFPFEVWRLDNPIDPHIPLLVTPDLSQAYSLQPWVSIFPEDERGMQYYYFYHHQKGAKTFWQTYQLQNQSVRQGTSDMEADITEFLSGQGASTTFDLSFVAGVKPVWSLSLKHEIEAPPGYSILGPIGKGRYGFVHRVLHSGLQEVRALKVLRPEAAQDPRIRKRFEIEAQAIARLRGKRVAIEVYEYSETEEGLPYIIMEFAQQGSLEEAMTRWGPKPWQEVLEITISCFRSLEVIHRTGVLHRDIKLSNILLSGDSFLFCDFGVGKFLDSELALTVEGDAIGTVGYMAPEQRHGLSDIRSDLFSLGICAVNLLAGESVVDARAWLYRHYNGNEDFRNALLSTIEAIPENRPPSSAAVSERLAGIRERLRQADNVDVLTEANSAAIVDGALKPLQRQMEAPLRIWKSPDSTIFREIPAGEFFMGGTKHPDERPVHKVRISRPFFLAATLVTNAQFSEFRRVTRYRGEHRNFVLHLRKAHFEPEWKDPNAPVVFLTWRDAKEYILWRCEKDNRDYRLPTEAQWEYACRAGTRTVYNWGNTFDQGNFNVNQIKGYPTPVGTYPANRWGLFDMLGNVWEWSEDVKDVLTSEESIFYRYCADLAGGLCVDPVNTDPSPMLSRRIQVGLRSVRGGSFFSESRNCRPANRRGQAQDQAVRSVSFRLALFDAPEKELVAAPLDDKNKSLT